jgi:hypothetical protein
MSRRVALILPKDVAHVVLTQWLRLKAWFDSTLRFVRTGTARQAQQRSIELSKISVKLYNPGRHASAPNRVNITFNNSETVDFVDGASRPGCG